MKRSPLKRGASKLKRTRLAPRSEKRRTETPSPEELAARDRWHLATVHDARCACCGRPGGMHGHHVVLARHVRKMGGDVWDLRNRMSLHPECHLNHHHGGDRQRIPRSALSDEQVAFAFELFGGDAEAYLQRHYPSDAFAH